MSKPIVTLALSDDGNSVFVYSGGLVDPQPHQPHDDTRHLLACVSVSHERLKQVLAEYVDLIVKSEIQA